MTHPSSSLEKKYEKNDNIINLNSHINKFNKNENQFYSKKLNDSSNNNKSNYPTKTSLKSKKGSIPHVRSSSYTQLPSQSTINNSGKEKRVSSAKINRNKTSSNYIFQTPFEPNETIDKPLIITSN